MHKILVVTIEPPQTSSGLGTLWAKLASQIETNKLQIDFLGPNPELCSPYGKSGIQIKGKLHYVSPPPLSWFLSVKRNKNKGIQKFFWSILYFPFVIQKYIFKSYQNSYLDWFSSQVKSVLPEIIKAENYDAVACHVPPFNILQNVVDITEKLHIPFIYIVGDPIGFRDENGGFIPDHKQLQQEIINKAFVLVTTKETYQRYYSKAFDISIEKLVFFSDCYLEIDNNEQVESLIQPNSIMHWGSIAPWRPVDKFVKALDRFNECKENKQPLKFIIVGKVHDKQQRKILNGAHTKISYSDLMPYAEARLTAQNADFYMISVSARHMDNIPSKLVDLMSFKRPILLLAHPQSEASKEILSLGIGLSAHPQDENGIYEAIQKLVLHREKFISAYENTSISTSWRCSSVASSFSDSLISVLTS
jgi:hypothetical protein